MQCRVCKKNKYDDEFQIRNKKTGLLRKECKKCCQERAKEWRKNNPEKMKARSERVYNKYHITACEFCKIRFKPSGGAMKFCSLKCQILGKMKVSENDCWEWTGTLNHQGYGKTKVEGKHFSTHRLSYILYKGEISNNLYVLH